MNKLNQNSSLTNKKSKSNMLKVIATTALLSMISSVNAQENLKNDHSKWQNKISNPSALSLKETNYTGYDPKWFNKDFTLYKVQWSNGKETLFSITGKMVEVWMKKNKANFELDVPSLDKDFLSALLKNADALPTLHPNDIIRIHSTNISSFFIISINNVDYILYLISWAIIIAP